MNQTIKNVLGVVAVIALVFAAVALWNGVSAYSRSSVSAATFQVTGQGKSVGTPDVAEFTFSVVSQGGLDVASLQQANTTATNNAIAFVKSDGVAAADITTEGYDIEPRYTSCTPQPVIFNASSNLTMGAMPQTQVCPPQSIVGYTVTQTVQVKIRDFSKIGDILSGVTSKGANSVSGLTFTVDNPSQLTNDARTKAITDAQSQAQAMAAAGGFKLGRLIGVDDQSDNNNVYPRAYSDAVGSAAGVSAAAPADIEAGSQEVDETVTLTYEIQ